MPFLNLWNEVYKQYYSSTKFVCSAIFYTLMARVGTWFWPKPSYYNLHPAMDHYIIVSTLLPDLLLISFFRYVCISRGYYMAVQRYEISL